MPSALDGVSGFGRLKPAMSHPDAELHLTASGTAKAVVDAHSDEQGLKLYSGWFCPFAQRVWIVLEEKQIPYQYIEVNPYHKPESLLSLNPRGLVPTLEYEKKPLYESTVICEFLEDAYPDHEIKLLPGDPFLRARMRIWIDFVGTRVIPAFHRFLQFQPSQQGEKTIDDVRNGFLDTLKQFAAAMDDEEPFFLGKEPTLVDFAMAPWAIRLWVFDHYKRGGLGIPDEGKGGEEEKSWARWRTWLGAINRRKSVVHTTCEKEHYLPIYQR